MKRIIISIVIYISISFLIYGLPPRGCGACGWDKLDKIRTLQILTLKEVKYSGEYRIDLSMIKNALETAGIRDKISIELFFNNRLLANLGSYKPSIENKKSRFYSMRTNKDILSLFFIPPKLTITPKCLMEP